MPLVRDTLSRFRDHVNEPEIHKQTTKDPALFAQLCSAMDVIGDTEDAIQAYRSFPSKERNVAELYLLTYGVFQAMVGQQDAVAHAAEAIGLHYTPSDKLASIRELWAKSVGHPTKYGEPAKSFGISGHSLRLEGFTLLQFDINMKGQIQYVVTHYIINEQEAEIVAALERLISRLVPPGPRTSSN